MIKIERILTPTDFSDCSAHAMVYAKSFAKEFHARLYVLHVLESVPLTGAFDIPPFPVLEVEKEVLDSSQKELDRIVGEELKGIQVEAVMKKGSPVQEIIDFAKSENVDIIIIGTHGRSGLDHMVFGSVTEKIIRKAPCPVLTVCHTVHDFVGK